MLRSALVAYAVALGVAAWSGYAYSAQSAKPTSDTPKARRATNALNFLEAKGSCAGMPDKSLGAFTDFTPQGGNFIVHVSQNGRSFTVEANPTTGDVACSD